MWRSLIGTVVLVGMGVDRPSTAQADVQSNPPLAIRSLDGPDLFAFYCATCHGRDGQGNGRVAPALKVHPPDLTTIARRNGGTFPPARVESAVTGERRDPSPAHGTTEMPVLGPVLRVWEPPEALD